ncbi:MAG: aspartate/glutamate racemase family protein, partial [Bacteroidales bacterium]
MLKQLQSISVGIFDSGVGGLSVWKEAIKILPDHNFLYFSDNAYSPYGPRAVQEIIERAKIISKFLIEKGAGIIVVACNTATAAAIDSLRENFSTPFIGMEPAVKPAAALTKTGVIGVL